jgi:hypothetical protein
MPTPPAGSPTTPMATATPTATRAVVNVEMAIGAVQTVFGEPVVVPVVLTAGDNVAGMQNDIGFPADAPIGARANGRPDCTVNPQIGKDGASFGFQPPGCTAGVDCTSIRALILSLDSVDVIPAGSVLYSCVINVAATAPAGALPLICSLAGASDADGTALPVTCADGEILNHQAVP